MHILKNLKQFTYIVIVVLAWLSLTKMDTNIYSFMNEQILFEFVLPDKGNF